MSPEAFSESVVEQAALAWFEALGYGILSGASIAPGEPGAERARYDRAVLERRLREALARVNPDAHLDALDEAFRKLTHLASPSLVSTNQEFHRHLVEGITAEVRGPEGGTAYDTVQLFDFDDPDQNDWLVVNQFTMVEGGRTRRADLVLFVNGLPLAVLELKNPASDAASLDAAFRQIQTYKRDIPSLFIFNEALVISDGMEARVGTVTASREWFMPWRTIEGRDVAPSSVSELEVLLRGVFEKRRFLDLVRHYILFESDGGGAVAKKMAGYHQYHAVNVAVGETARAAAAAGDEAREPGGRYFAGPPRWAGEPGDRRVGVVWHTQGSGKSLTMVFYAGRIVIHPAMENPTIVVITDRNDLDQQLFGTFSRCSDLLRQTPAQAASRSHLRELLRVAAGGIVFTTIHKFLPEAVGRRDEEPLSKRRNIVVMADEAHRSQYDFIDGLARHLHEALPNASFIGFTGTPVELADRNTRAVFGDYISIYDIQRAVHDGATVPIYYESRLARLALKEEEKPRVDPEFEEVTEGEELEGKERLKSKWSALEALVGTEKRIRVIAQDLVRHFEARLEVMDGKALVVCMSRRICVELYEALAALRPGWRDPDDARGALKVVMTGSAGDPPEWQEHIRSKGRREQLAHRFRKPDDPLKVVIVRDMWLTGFDAPCLHTMYLDKPMGGHNLMQAIARVNRVFRDKPGGLVVDYLGLAEQLKSALRTYTESGGRGEATFDQLAAVAVMIEKYEVCRGLFHGFDRSAWTAGSPAERLSLLPAAQEHVLALEDGRARFMAAVADLSKAFALAVPHEETARIRDEVAFFQTVRAALAKTTGNGAGRPKGAMEHAIRQIISRALTTEDVLDLFEAAGLKKPDISILSEAFLAEIGGMKHRNLAVELLRKLLNDDLKRRERKFLVQARSFRELLELAIRRYRNRAIEAAQVIQEMIDLAGAMREADRRGERLGLTPEEVAFYDALEVNDSAVKVLGDETLKGIARELVDSVRRNVTIDWTIRESVRAKLRVLVKRILRRHGYPPDKQEAATRTVLEQAELLCDGWTTDDTAAV